MTNKQATDIAAQVSGVEVREHPKSTGAGSWYYAVCGKRGVTDGALNAVRKLIVAAGCGYCVDEAPAWAADCAFAIY